MLSFVWCVEFGLYFVAWVVQIRVVAMLTAILLHFHTRWFITSFDLVSWTITRSW